MCKSDGIEYTGLVDGLAYHLFMFRRSIDKMNKMETDIEQKTAMKPNFKELKE